MRNDFTDVSVLVIGDIGPWLDIENKLPQINNTVVCLYDDLTLEFMETHRPDMVLSPLISSRYDVLDLAQKLSDMDFAGRLRVICAALPNLELISTEVRFEYPDIDFDLIVVKPSHTLRSV